MSWPSRVLCFDTETSGIRVFEDRIVQMFIGIADENGDLVERYEWIINPGIEIPEEASAVHGFTTEYLQEYGAEPGGALETVMDVFRLYKDIPWCAFNLNFDLSILVAEFKRYGFGDGFGGFALKKDNLWDGLVIDRAQDKYRKGKRNLENMARVYGVPFDADAAHKADYDVEITAKVTREIIEKFGVPTTKQQKVWYADWAEHLEEYLRRTDPAAKVDRGWPLRREGEGA